MKATLITLIEFIVSFLIILSIELILKKITNNKELYKEYNKLSAIMEDLSMDSLEKLGYYKMLEKFEK